MTDRTEQSIPRTYLVNPGTVKKLDQLEAKFRLNKSDSVRRGVDMLHDYLILRKVPKKPKAPNGKK